MQRRLFVLAGPALRLVLCAAFLAASAGAPARAADATVHIDNFSFSPALITVAAGTTITWDNRDDIPHTVTEASSPPQFRSPAMDTDGKFSHEFTAPGTYHYFCSLHPHMLGTVVVQ